MPPSSSVDSEPSLLHERAVREAEAQGQYQVQYAGTAWMPVESERVLRALENCYRDTAPVLGLMHGGQTIRTRYGWYRWVKAEPISIAEELDRR